MARRYVADRTDVRRARAADAKVGGRPVNTQRLLLSVHRDRRGL